MPHDCKNMFPRIYRHPHFRQGCLDLLPIALGIGAWGMMTAVAMVKSGMTPAEATLMTLLVYAGSSQLAAIPLLAAGAPLWVIWATSFCVNLRFVVFSAHLRGYMMHMPLWRRLLSGYFMTDNNYAVFTKRYPLPARSARGRVEQHAYFAGACFVNWACWITASLLGIGLTHAIPTHWGLGFAGLLALLGIMCALAGSRMHVLSAISAAVAALLFYSLPLRLNIVTGIAIAVAVCLLMERFQKPKEVA
jgi:predicted branched-subunit amino acid permease